MGSVLKGNRYRLVDNRSFELPLPIKYELLKEDDPIAEYEISKDEKVTCHILTKFKENMITPIYRPLTISDVYYFFSCRVFQDRTPFTMTELSLLGLERYNVYDIIRKTRGVTPFDTYWLRFDGDKCDYNTARGAWDSLMQQTGAPAAHSSGSNSETSVPKSDANVGEILNQHKVDIAAKFAANEEISKKDLGEPERVANNTMSADEIEALLLKSGLSDLSFDSKPEKPAPAEEKSSGGMMSQADIEAMLAAASAPEPAPVEEKPSGGKMSQEDIEAMLAAASAPEPEKPAPVEEKPSGGKMSQEDIEAMLAAASAPEPEKPAHVEEKPSGGKMSQEDIEAMLAAASAPAPATPAPVEEKPSGGKMSQEDIEAMLAAASAPETEKPAPVEEKPSGGKMSQEDIEAMLAAASAPEPEKPAPVEEKPSGGKMSQEDIEAMIAAASAPAPATPAPVEEKPSGGKMSQEDIEAMLAAASGAVDNAAADTAEAVQETLEDTVAEEKPKDAASSSGGKMSQADIEALLNGMKEDASK